MLLFCFFFFFPPGFLLSVYCIICIICIFYFTSSHILDIFLVQYPIEYNPYSRCATSSQSLAVSTARCAPQVPPSQIHTTYLHRALVAIFTFPRLGTRITRTHLPCQEVGKVSTAGVLPNTGRKLSLQNTYASYTSASRVHTVARARSAVDTPRGHARLFYHLFFLYPPVYLS
ncbi:hypothetical protein GGS23DRAFT_393773 [Durotheca rogersii]|uniref:uncharacterized protein n=1 Tax=Durotheca rogersii TaxID=419775 RepID=UPI00221F2721|nr:uncharacterized protein GGS23DRAFT_393773 [Durotheca rogersii]KAI5856789.1 hypothetical protein GGS23DRAFT_393773 [Durotheca rogersii]